MASLCIVNGILECPPQQDPQPYGDPPGGFSKHLQGAPSPPWIIGRNSVTAWEAHIMGAEWAREWSWWCATTHAPGTPAPQYAAVPFGGSGPHTQPRPTMIRGAGPERPWDVAGAEWLRVAPEPRAEPSGDVSSLIRAPLPPRFVLHAASMLQATEIHTWRCDTANVRWLPPEDVGTRLTVAHFKERGPTYDDAVSRRSDVPGLLLLMLLTDFAAALRWELDGCDRLKVGWEAVADGTLLPVLHRDTADGCRWDALVPHLTRRHTYMTTPPRGTPARRGMTSSRSPTTTASSPTTRGKRSGGKRSVATTDAVSAPACWNSGTPFYNSATTSGSAASTPGHQPPTSHTPATSARSATRCPPPCRRVAAWPWLEPPAGPRRRTEEEALHRRIKDAQIPSHGKAGPPGAALLWLHVHLRDPTSVANLWQVFAP